MNGTLWLCIAPRRLPLDALGPETPEGMVVTARHGARRWVVASAEGIFPGADAGAVLAARPELRLCDAQPDRERLALQQLATVAHCLGQPVHLAYQPASPEMPAGHAAVWVEISRSRRLFDGSAGVMQRARALLSEQPLDCALAIAPSLAGAALAARCDDGRILEKCDALHDWLQPVALHAMHLPARTRDGLHASGIRRLGKLLEMPVDQLARRFGADLVLQLDRLTGRSPDPQAAHQLPRQFSRRSRFDGAVHHVEGLLFPLRHSFGALALYLRARDCGARSVLLTLHHEDAPPTRLTLSLAAPARDAGYWLLMARERLSRLTLPGQVTALELHSREFAPLDAPQLDLFDSSRAEEDAWRQTVERLIARLGEEAVWQLGTADDHRPEKSWQRLPALRQKPEDAAHAAAERPLWLLDPPRPLRQPPSVRGGPERIESGWWDGEDAARDYYTADGDDGMRLWVYRDHAAQRWFLHGLWA